VAYQCVTRSSVDTIDAPQGDTTDNLLPEECQFVLLTHEQVMALEMGLPAAQFGGEALSMGFAVACSVAYCVEKLRARLGA
jgi:hypothetical protein